MPTDPKELLEAKLDGQRKRALGLRERHEADSPGRAMCDNVLQKVRASVPYLRAENLRQVEAFVAENGKLLDDVEDLAR